MNKNFLIDKFLCSNSLEFYVLKISLEVLKIPFWRIFTLNEQRTWGKYQHIDVDCDWGIKSVRSIFSESI